jgi:branched-chain amino acid transport system substrate-binding protein
LKKWCTAVKHASRRGLGTKVAALIIIVIIIAGAAGYYLYAHKGGKKTIPAGNIIKIGFTAPLSGPNKDIGQDFLNGLKLWADTVNSMGGINIGGKTYAVVLKYYDDKGDPQETQKLYTQLIEKDFVDFLVTPPLDQCAFQAINVAEQHGKIIIDVTSGDELFRAGLKYTYQVATPATQVFVPVLELAKSTDPNATKIAIIAIDTPAAKRMAAGVKVWAGTNNYQVVLEYYYVPGTTSFTGIARIVAERSPDIIVGGGGIQETISLVKALYQAGVRPKVTALLGGPLSDQFAQLGDIAVGIMGVSEWETVATYSPFKAKSLNATWYGPGVTEFTVNYEKTYGTTPTSTAAAAYTAGLVLQYALEKAKSMSTTDVENVLDNARLLTFYGLVQFDNTPELHGLQIAHEAIVVQWMVKGGNMVKLVVAPKEFAVASPIYPLPWS